MHLLTVVNALWLAAGVLLLLPCIVLACEVVLAVTDDGKVSTWAGPRVRSAIVVPAHNEASILASTLRSLAPQLAQGDRLLVVADNCSDATASVAAAEQAEVL